MVTLLLFQSFSSLSYKRNVPPTQTIAEIKTSLLECTKVASITEIKLVYRGKVLENEKKLEEYVDSCNQEEEVKIQISIAAKSKTPVDNSASIVTFNNSNTNIIEMKEKELKEVKEDRSTSINNNDLNVISTPITIKSSPSTNDTSFINSPMVFDNEVKSTPAFKSTPVNDIRPKPASEFKGRMSMGNTPKRTWGATFDPSNIVQEPSPAPSTISSNTSSTNDSSFPSSKPSLASTNSLTSAMNRNNISDHKTEIVNDSDNKKDNKPKISWIAALNAHYGQTNQTINNSYTTTTTPSTTSSVIPPISQFRPLPIPVVPFPRPQNHVHEYRNEHMHGHHNHQQHLNENNHHINHQHIHNHLHNQHVHNPAAQPIAVDNGRRIFQPMLLIKLALIVSVLTYDQSLYRTLLVLFVAIAYYLYEVFAPPANAAPVANNGEDIDENQDVIDQLRREHEENQQPPRERELEGGVLKNMERFVIGFFASLSPSWHPRR